LTLKVSIVLVELFRTFFIFSARPHPLESHTSLLKTSTMGVLPFRQLHERYSRLLHVYMVYVNVLWCCLSTI